MLCDSLAVRVTSNYALTLQADYAAFDEHTQSDAATKEAMALEIVKNGLGIDDDESLSDLEITISDVRSGSIIIDYALTANSESSMETAVSNMDKSMGTTVVIDGFEFPFSSNVDLDDECQASDQYNVNWHQLVSRHISNPRIDIGIICHIHQILSGMACWTIHLETSDSQCFPSLRQLGPKWIEFAIDLIRIGHPFWNLN